MGGVGGEKQESGEWGVKRSTADSLQSTDDSARAENLTQSHKGRREEEEFTTELAEESRGNGEEEAGMKVSATIWRIDFAWKGGVGVTRGGVT